MEAPFRNLHFFFITLLPLGVAQLIDIGINEHLVPDPDKVQVCVVFLVMVLHDLGFRIGINRLKIIEFGQFVQAQYFIQLLKKGQVFFSVGIV